MELQSTKRCADVHKPSGRRELSRAFGRSALFPDGTRLTVYTVFITAADPQLAATSGPRSEEVGQNGGAWIGGRFGSSVRIPAVRQKAGGSGWCSPPCWLTC